MNSADQLHAPCALPQGVALVPLEADRGSGGGAVRICLAMRNPPDPARGALVVLRETPDARILLGCLADRGQRIHEWLEIWIQNPPRSPKTPSTIAEMQTNAGMDQRWRLLVEAIEKVTADLLIRTGWESTPMPASFVDTAKLTARAVTTPNRAWSLCRDEAMLQSASLPSYSASAHRYLVGVEEGAAPAFVALTADAPVPNGVRTLDQALGGANLIPLNPTAGMMLVRKHTPMRLEAYLDALTSGRADAGRADAPTDDWAQSGWMFLGSGGASGRVLESLHLKIRLICQVIDSVMQTVRATKRPLLSLEQNSFAVRCGQAAHGLPALWNACAELVDPCPAMELQISGTDMRFFTPAQVNEASIYRRSGVQSTSGKASVRVRQVLSAAGGTSIVEGTLATQERLAPEAADLVCFKLTLPSKSVELYARAEAEKALAPGEWRIRTVPTRLDEQAVKEIKAAMGVLFDDVRFEHLPLLSTPADLYSLGVLATRALLVNPQTTLPVALDELWSLARHAASDPHNAAPLAQRIGQAMAKDPRLLEQLGPHRLVHDPMPSSEAMNLVPADVWWEVLAGIIRMFPGLTRDSLFRGAGEAPPNGAHQVFEKPLHEFETLLLRTRSMILIDWNANREIHAVIRSMISGLRQPPGRNHDGKHHDDEEKLRVNRGSTTPRVSV